jgi:alkylation response protein AidB-like acyl-CoA dehydrogenase
MMFDLTSEQQAARERARAFAQQRLAASASAIDEQNAIAGDLLRDAQAVLADVHDDATALVVCVEQLATVNAAAGAAAALGQSASTPVAPDRPGLRGLAVPARADARGRLLFAAVACGVGCAAIEAALDALRGAAPGVEDQEKPHWVVADAATELEAARMLTLQAAGRIDEDGQADGFAAIAKLTATRAAAQAVDAALRVAGPGAFVRGAMLERLARDVRALSLIAGGEEELRATAAQALLPG